MRVRHTGTGSGSAGNTFRAALLSGAAVTLAFGTAAQAQTAPVLAQSPKQGSDSAEVVTVTAQRRAENQQKVPISIQTLSGEQLKRLNVENFDDLQKNLPNVTSGGFGPGQVNVYMRGLSIGGDEGGQGGGGVGSFPNVAIYLDDQSAQVPGRNLDLYPADLNRVEVLEGPQGTLFGSGAQAGVVRYITNKPDLNRTQVTVDLGAADTVHGAPSGNGDIIINEPIVPGKMALRLVVYDDRRGGYIDNVPGTFVRQATDKGIYYAGYTHNIPGPATRLNSANNYRYVGKDINPATYRGIRGELAIKFNDDWNLLISEAAQGLDAEGVFYEQPYTSGSNPVKLPPLSVQTFQPNYDKDSFEETSYTLTGRIGDLNLVYDGGYLQRNTDQLQDYTNYARGIYADYYQCTPPNAKRGIKAQCYSPLATWHDLEHDTHFSQELRLSTPDDWRLRAIGGVFYEYFKVDNRTDFNYRTAPGFTNIGPPPGTTAVDPSVRGNNTGFFNDITRGYGQYAVFGSADYDIIPNVLTATVGTRWFAFHSFEKGYVDTSFGCYLVATPAPCATNGNNLDKRHLENTAYGFRSRANLTYHLTPDIMLYFTWSQGYRPDGYNRKPPTTKDFIGQYFYTSDSLTNYEVGYKTQFWDHRVTLNGAFYEEEWNSVQDRLFDPGVFGNLAFTVNGPNYRVLGTEMQATVHPTDALTLSGGFALNNTKQLTSPPILSQAGVPLPGSVGVFGQVGDTLAQSPIFKGDIRARYEWTIDDYECFAQLGGQYSGHQHSAVANFNNFYEKPIGTADVSAGVGRGNWRAQAYIDNLTNTNGQLFISAAQFVRSVIVTRPFTGGMKFSYTFF
jgi:iron complex outermembrane receptor protein